MAPRVRPAAEPLPTNGRSRRSARGRPPRTAEFPLTPCDAQRTLRFLPNGKSCMATTRRWPTTYRSHVWLLGGPDVSNFNLSSSIGALVIVVALAACSGARTGSMSEAPSLDPDPTPVKLAELAMSTPTACTQDATPVELAQLILDLEADPANDALALVTRPIPVDVGGGQLRQCIPLLGKLVSVRPGPQLPPEANCQCGATVIAALSALVRLKPLLALRLLGLRR